MQDLIVSDKKAVKDLEDVALAYLYDLIQMATTSVPTMGQIETFVFALDMCESPEARLKNGSPILNYAAELGATPYVEQCLHAGAELGDESGR